MISDQSTEAFVWIWLPGHEEPVVAGRIEQVDQITYFNYGQSYLERPDAIPLYLPELPLERGRIRPLEDLTIAGCLNDAGPDGWGQRVIMHRKLGSASRQTDPAQLSPISYLLESGSNRIGALDFQTSPLEHVTRGSEANIEELMQAAERVQEGLPFSAELDEALLHASSVGGARPKALLSGGMTESVAKFSSSSDSYPILKGEYAAMDLARRVGIDAAPVRLIEVMGRDVLLIERFDRIAGTKQRRGMVSALTILGLDEMYGRYATYFDLAEVIRQRFTDAESTLRELFARIVFNILVGNTDDHARNHAAFWDGDLLTLTPGYDICPQNRAGGETVQAMAIGPDGFRMSQLAGCVSAAHLYLVSEVDAREIIDYQVSTIREQWTEVADNARMTEADRAYFWGRQFLKPYAFAGY